MNPVLEIVNGFVQKADTGRPILIGIDGKDGAGKSQLATSIASWLKTTSDRTIVHSSIDFFHNPKAIRHQSGKESHVSFFEDSFNYQALKTKLLDPLKNGSNNSYYLKHFDHKLDSEVTVPEQPVSEKVLLIFDGIFVHRDELAAYWDFSLYLDVPFEETYRRMATRDGCHPDPLNESNARWYLGQKIYIERCNPASRASIVVDNSDYNNPKLKR